MQPLPLSAALQHPRPVELPCIQLPFVGYPEPFPVPTGALASDRLMLGNPGASTHPPITGINPPTHQPLAFPPPRPT